jgi:hypothetical protein
MPFGMVILNSVLRGSFAAGTNSKISEPFHRIRPFTDGDIIKRPAGSPLSNAFINRTG